MFGPLKEALEGKKFGRDEEIQGAVHMLQDQSDYVFFFLLEENGD